MKILKLIPLTFLALSACAVSDLKGTEIETSSGIVQFALINTDSENPSLPTQISVTFEKPSDPFINLKIEKLDHFYLATPTSVATVTFGCDWTSEVVEVLPASIDADTVILCGNLKVPPIFRLTANNLILQNATLKAVRSSDNAEAYLMFNVLGLSLIGDNHLNLVGEKTKKGQAIAPAAFFDLGFVIGDGKLNVFSAKSSVIL